jgi:Domain of unknown function (DUF4157)
VLTFAQKPMVSRQLTSVGSPPPVRAHMGQSRKLNSSLLLQRTIGDQAVQRFPRAKPDGHETVSGTTASGCFGSDFSRIPVHAEAPAEIQSKLAVNAPGDIYEQEADRISEQVMQMSEQRFRLACLGGGGCPRYQTKQPGQADRPHTDHLGSGYMAQVIVPPIIDEVVSSPGQPLDTVTRSFIEPRFGHDFSEVRVHTDGKAAESARAVNAQAYTVGSDVVFGTGRYAPGSAEGTRLLAHELTHVVQQVWSGPSLQRKPKPVKPDVHPETKSPKPSPKDSDPKLRPFVSADLIAEIKRDNETWMLTINGFSSPESVRHLIWPYFVPPGITIDLKVAITDPIERGWFVLNGVTLDTVQFMEPSIAKMFSDHGLVADAKESEELRKARIAFIERHSDYSDAVLYNMVVALNRITKRNPDLLLAYYKYYAHNHLRDETKWNDSISDKDYNPDKNTGATAYGGTVINPRVLDKTSNFPTDDPTSLLAGTLIHEFVHTPQGGGDTGVSSAPKEAKAYGIELFYSERMGDKARARVIENMSWSSPIDIQTGADKIFRESYETMKALYEVIDQGGPAAKEAREMSVEFISKNEADYGTKLKDFISKHRL